MSQKPEEKANTKIDKDSVFRVDNDSPYKQALLLEEAGDFIQALQKYSQQIIENPNFIDCYVRIFRIHMNSKAFWSAIEILESCFDNILLFHRSYELLAELIVQIGINSTMQGQLDRFSSQINTFIQETISLECWIPIRTSRALDTPSLKRIITSNPKYAQQQTAIASMLLFEATKYSKHEALSIAKSLLNNSIDVCFCCYKLACYYIQCSVFSLAQIELSELLQRVPTHSAGLFQLGKIELFKNKNSKIALKYLKKRIRQNDGQFDIYNALGIAYYKQGKINYALESLQMGQKLNLTGKTNQKAQFTFGKTLTLIGKTTEALTVMELLRKECNVSKEKFSLRLDYYTGVLKMQMNQKYIKTKNLYYGYFLRSLQIPNMLFKPLACKIVIKEQLNQRKYHTLRIFLRDFNFLGRGIEYCPAEDQDLCAILSEAILQTGFHPYLAMPYIEKAFKNPLLFKENEDKEELFGVDESSHFGCLIQLIKIRFMLSNQDIENTINYEKNKKSNHNTWVQFDAEKMIEFLQKAQIHSEQLKMALREANKDEKEIKNVEDKLLMKKTWGMIDWNETADILIAEIYSSVNQFIQAAAILDRITSKSQNLDAINQTQQLQKLIKLASCKTLTFCPRYCTSVSQEQTAFRFALKTLQKLNTSLQLAETQSSKEHLQNQALWKFQQSILLKVLQRSKRNHLFLLMRVIFKLQNEQYLLEYRKDIIEQNKFLTELYQARDINVIPPRIILETCDCLSMLGELFLLQKDLVKALECFSNSLNTDPFNVRSLKGYISVYVQKQDYLEAQQVLNMVPLENQDSDFHYLQGECYYQGGKKLQAKQSFEKAYVLDPNHTLLLKALGRMYFEEGQLSIAQNFYEKLFILSRSYDEQVLISLGECYWQEGKNLTKAQQFFHKSLENNLQKERSFNAFVKFHKETKLLPDPVILFKDTVFYKNELSLLRYFASSFLNAANTDPSKIINFDYSLKFLDLIMDLHLKNQTENNKQVLSNLDYKAAISISYYEYSLILFLKGEKLKSYNAITTIKVFKYLSSASPNSEIIDQQTLDFYSSLLRAKLAMQLGMSEVPPLLMKCLRIFPQRQKLLHFIMARYLLTQNSKSAWQFFDSGQSSSSCYMAQEREELTFLKIHSFFSRDEPQLDKAQEKTLKFLKNYPQSSSIFYYLLGQILLKKEQFSQAIEQFEKCLKNNQNYLQSLYSIPLSHNEHLNCLYSIAKAHMKLNNFKDALIILGKCLSIDSSYSAAIALKSQIHYEAGNYLKSIEQAADIYNQQDSSAETFYLLGLAQIRSGNILSGIVSLKKCLFIDQKYPKIHLKISSVYEFIHKPEIALQFALQHLAYYPTSAQGLIRSSKLFLQLRKAFPAQTHLDRLFDVALKNQSLNEQTQSSKDRTKQVIKSDYILEVESEFDDEAVTLAECYLLQGNIHQYNGNYQLAVSSLSESLKFDKQNEETLYSLALVFSKLGNHKEAIRIYKQLLKLDKQGNQNHSPNKREAYCYYTNLGNAYTKIGKRTKAIQTYQKITSKVQTEYEDISFANIGACYIASNSFDFAIDILNQALPSEQISAEIHFLLGLAWKAKGNIQNSISHLKLSIKSDNSYTPAYLTLARLKRDTPSNNILEAIQICQSCLEYAPTSLQVLQQLSDYQLEVGDYWAALSLSETILTQLQGNLNSSSLVSQDNQEIYTKANLQISRIYFKLHGHDKAVQFIEKCLIESPDNPGYLHELGRIIILSDTPDFTKAQQFFMQAVNACPNNPNYVFSLADCFHRMHHYALEIASLLDCLSLNPSFAEKIYNNIALSYATIHQNQLALEFFQKGIAVYPKSSFLQFNLGNYWFSRNNLPDAAQHYEQCIKLNPYLLAAHNNLAVVSARLKDFKRARECYTVCLQLQPEKKGVFSSKIASLLIKENQSETAH